MSHRSIRELNADSLCVCCGINEMISSTMLDKCGECVRHGAQPCTVVTGLTVLKRALACLNHMPRTRIPMHMFGDDARPAKPITSYDVAAQLEKLIKSMEAEAEEE